ncbi:MAG: hypothetical protein K8S99_13450 [Planctomycetes bacterium]|nr:hypothetical protein [Planctomycetota bacterium]
MSWNMNTCVHAVAAAVLAGASMGLLTGCHQPPRPQSTYHEADLSVPSSSSGVDVNSAIWDRGKLPNLGVHEGKRVAIVQFEVEFVTSAWEAPPWVPASPDQTEEPKKARQLRLEAFQRKTITYPPGFEKQMADELYAMLVTELEKHGRSVVPVREMRASQVYNRLKRYDGAQSRGMDTAYRADPDMSYPNGVVVCPGGGLGSVDGSDAGPIEEVAIALLKELNADVAAAARLRVSVFRGRATIERGSKVWLLSRDVYGTGAMVRSLASDRGVVVQPEFHAVYPNRYDIDADAYRAAMQKMFPALITLVLQPPPAAVK